MVGWWRHAAVRLIHSPLQQRRTAPAEIMRIRRPRGELFPTKVTTNVVGMFTEYLELFDINFGLFKAHDEVLAVDWCLRKKGKSGHRKHLVRILY